MYRLYSVTYSNSWSGVAAWNESAAAGATGQHNGRSGEEREFVRCGRISKNDRSLPSILHIATALCHMWRSCHLQHGPVEGLFELFVFLKCWLFLHEEHHYLILSFFRSFSHPTTTFYFIVNISVVGLLVFFFKFIFVLVSSRPVRRWASRRAPPRRPPPPPRPGTTHTSSTWTLRTRAR